MSLTGPSRWKSRLPVWLPIPVVLAAMLILWRLDLQQAYEPPYLIGILNGIFSTAVALFISWLAARSFSREPALSLLLLGCGALAFGCVSLLAAMAVQYGHLNAALTIYNGGACLAALCHLLTAAVVGSRFRASLPILWLGGFYTVVLTVIAFLTWASFAGQMPAFFVEGQGPTPIRQTVLGAAIVFYALGAVVSTLNGRRQYTSFVRLYATGLGLLATGLLGVMLISSLGTPLNWLGRGAQYLGGLYILIAVVSAARHSGNWQLALLHALRTSEDRFRALIEASAQIVWTLDPDGAIDEDCSTWGDFTGQTAAQIRDGGWLDAVHAEDREQAGRWWEHCFATLTPLDTEFRVRRVSGEYRWTAVRGVPLFSTDGRLTGWVGANTDIHDRKLAEQALRESVEALNQAHDELEQRVRRRTAELQVRADQLARLTSELTLAEHRERQRLAQILHDDLQQLLVGARFGLDVLSRRVDDEQKQALESVNGLIDEAFKVSRSLTDELAPPILLEAGLLAGLEWLARWMNQHHGLRVDLHLDPAAIVDREDVVILIYQSVRELLLNVVKHAQVSHASLAVWPEGLGQVGVTVSDNGVGFDPAAADPAEHGLNSGFGLFSIRERILAFDGRFEIESSPGRGTRLSLVLPARSAGTESEALTLLPAPTEAAPPAREAAASTGGNGRVRLLLVDDHAVVRQGLHALLAEEPRLEVVAQAGSGSEALEKARACNPDVVLMDFSMPGMDGVETTRRLLAEMPQVSVIGLSMYEQSDRASAMLEAGASTYLAKSGAPEILVRTIFEVHQKAKSPLGAASN